MNDNKRKLYDALSQDYDLGTFEQFESDIADAGKRRKLYDATIEEYDFGDFAEFENQLGFAPQVQAEPPQGFLGKAYAQATRPAADVVKPAPQLGDDKSGYTFTAEELERMDKPEKPQDDNQAGVQSSIIPGMKYGELATSFMEDINLRKRVSNAEVDDSAVEAALQKANARRSAQMQQGATMRGAFDRALATTKRNESAKSLEEQLGAAEGNIVQMLGERDAQIESANRERENNTPWYARLGAAKGGGIPSQAMTSNGRFTDPEWRMLNAANRIIGESKELIDAAKNDRGMWTGIGRTLADIDTWTSLMEGLDAKAIADVADVDLEKATPAQLALLDALAMRVAVEEQYGGDISNWYKAGETIGNMAPLAAETMLNPASGLGRKAAQAMLKKVATKGAKGLAKRIGQQAAIKGAGYLGSMAGGAAMSSTTSLPGIAVRAKMNSIGDAQYDVDQYGNVGFAGFKPGESYGKEFLKEFGRTTFERATEQMGAEWLSKLIGKPLGWIGKGVMKMPGAKSVTGKVGDLLDNKVGDALKKLAKDVNYQGPIEEFGEEFVSALHTASIDGMDSLKKWFEGDNLETTAIAVTTPALLGLGASATYGAVDYKRGAKAKSKQMQAYKEGFEAFADMPEDWKNIVINLNSPSGIIDEMKRIYNDPIYTNKQKIAALTYGARTMAWMGTEGVKGVNTDENVRMLNEMLGARYREGYEQEPTGENAVKEANEYTNARNEVVRVLSLAEDADVDAMLEGKTPEEIAMGDGEIEDAVGRYIQARARRDGFRERYQEERDRQFAENDKSIDEKTNNGTVYGVATENGEAFITSGIVVLNEEGEIDYANSEGLVVMFPDGTKKPVQRGSLPGKVNVQNAEDLKAAGRASIEERWRAEFESAENAYVEQQKRAEGIVFDITDGEGTHRVEVVKEGDNMSNILVDGEQMQISTEELNALRGEAGVAQTESGEVEGENEVQPEVAPVQTELPKEKQSIAPIPTEKRGKEKRAAYHLVPIERTMEDLHDGSLEPEEIEMLIDARIKEAVNEVEAIEGRKPRIGADKDAYVAAKKQWQETMEAVKAKLEYYNQLKAANEEVTRSEMREAVEGIEPQVLIEQTVEEFVANQLGGLKITPESFQKETGLKAEQKQMVGVVAGKEKGGVSIEQAAEFILENYSDDLRALGFGGDMQDMRDMIIDILSKGNPRSFAKKGFEMRAQESVEQQRAELESVANRLNFNSIEEQIGYEEAVVPRIIQDYTGFDEQEYFNNLAENYGYDTTRESENTRGGSELLQGEQTADNTGDTDLGEPGQGGKVQGDVYSGGENAAPQGNQQQVSGSDFSNNQVAEGEGETESEKLKVESGTHPVADRVLAAAKEKQIARFAGHAKGIAEKLGIEVTVHNDESTVTNKDAMKAIAEGGVLKGWYNPTTGEIALFLPAMESMHDVESTILHEAVSHFGIKHFLGKEDFGKFLDGVWEMMPAGVRAHFLQYVGADMRNPSKAKMRQAADEYVAHIAENMDLNELEKSVWQRFIDYVMDVLRKAGFKNLKQRDVEAVIRASYANLRQNGGNSQVTGQGETMARKKMSERRQEKNRINNVLDEVGGIIYGNKEYAKKQRLKREAERKELAKEIYSSVLKGDFNDVTLSQIDKFIEDATPANPFGRRISQRLPQRMERALRAYERTNAVDALFSRISESAVPANERFSEAGRREIEERKKELLKGWAIATGNWHTDLKEFTDDTEPIGEGQDSKVYSAKEGPFVIKASKGKPYGKRFRPDIDNIALFNDVFRNSRYEILGYGEIDGDFVRILKQRAVDFSNSTPLAVEERVEYMKSLGFEPINKDNTAFSNGEIVIADLQKSNIVRDVEGDIRVIDADAKLHTKDVGGDYTYPPVETDLPEGTDLGGTMFRKVFHGSGAQFDKFDHSFMGTGEGNQAFGWGTYVTEVEGIGKQYANATSKPNLTYKGQEVDVEGFENPWRLINDLYEDTRGKLSEMRAKAERYEGLAEEDSLMKPVWKEVVRILKEARRGDLKASPRRVLYTVEIPDDNGSNYLHWEEVVPLNVVNAVKQRLFDELAKGDYKGVEKELKRELDDVFKYSDNEGYSLYGNISAYLGGSKAASRFLNEMGFVGISYPADGGRVGNKRNYVIFNEDDAVIEDRTMFRRANKNQDIFVSNAQRAVEGIKQEKATPEQWIAMLKKNGGLKAGEEAWLGLEEWLNEKQGAVTKQEILDFIGENKIQIEEVNYTQFGYGLMDEATRKLETELKEIGWDAMVEKYPGLDELFEVYDGELLWSEERASVGEYEDFIIDNKIVDLDSQSNAINETREKYTTEGLERKREIALTVPTVEPYNASDEIHFGDAGNGRAVAWVRFGETTDSEGNRVLVIDEIQSKRHQDGREKGYKNPNAEAELEKAENAYREAIKAEKAYNAELKEKYGYDSFEGSLFQRTEQFINSLTEEEKAKRNELKGEKEELAAAYDNLLKSVNGKGVPAAPFEKNWHELAMKRMLRLAAEEGFDKVAWTTGEQQAERYNLGGAVQEIKVEKYPRGYEVVSYGHNGNIVHSDVFSTPEAMAEVYGKELAQKIVGTADSNEGKAVINGDGLRIGGEGMKGFYDRMLPSFVQKYTKKWGAKVGTVEMPNLEQNNVMHSVDVTPEMKESVMEGQTMFRMGSRVDARMAEVASHFDGKELSAEQRAVADVFGGKADNLTISVKTQDGNTINVEMRQGNDLAGAKHSLYAHYGTTKGVINADDLLLIPDVIANGERTENGKKAVYKLDVNGTKYTVVTYVKQNKEEFHNFYSNKKGQPSQSVNAEIGDTQSARITEELASADKGSTSSAEMQEGETLFRKISYDEAVQIAEDFAKTYKGAAKRCIVSKGNDVLEQQMRDAGFDEEDIALAMAATEQELPPMAGHLWRSDGIVVFRYETDENLYEALWHENTHRALRKIYGNNRILAQTRFDELPEHIKQEYIDFLKAAGYKENKYAEETLCYFVGSRPRLIGYLKDGRNDLTSFYRNVDKNYKRFVDFAQNLIDYTVYHEEETEHRERFAESGEIAETTTEGGNVIHQRNSKDGGDAQGTGTAGTTGGLTDGEVNSQEGEMLFRKNVTEEEVIEQQEENEESIAKDAVTQLGEVLNAPVAIIDDLNSLPENRRNKKGWFDPKTGEVVVVIPNHVSSEDAVQTVLHEVVGHRGLRAVLGEKFDEFLDDVFKNASPEVKRGISDKFFGALRKGHALTVREATEEYIAELAERGFEGYNGVWNSIKQWLKDAFRSLVGFEVTDNELRYLLWKSYNRQKSGPIETILDIAMEAKTGTGNTMFRVVEDYNKGVQGVWNKTKEGWYDEMRSIKVAQEAIEKELGREVLDSENVYLYANHLPSINKNKKEVFDNKYLRPFTSLLKKLYELEVNGQKMDEKSVERYTNAKHGIERNREMSVKKALTEVQDGKKVFNEEAYAAWAQERDAVRKRKLPWAEEQRELDKVAKKYGAKIRDYSGLTAIFDVEGKMKYAQIADAAYKYVEDVESAGGKDVKELWTLIKGMTDYSLKEAYESGMMSKSTYEHIKQMYRYYVPLRGFTEQTAEDFFDYVEGDHSPLNAVVKTAKGRTSEAENIFATILNMANSAIVQGSKNRLKQRLLNLAMRSRTGLLSVDNAWYAKVGDEYIPMEYPEKADEYAAFEERMKELEKNGEVVRHRPGLEIGRKVADKWNQQQHAVRVKRNGREYVVWVNGDPRLANAVNGMLRENFDETRIGTLNRWRAQMVTQYSPTFIFTNLVRDVQEASMTYAVRRGTKMMGNFDLNVAANSVKMMSLYLKHKKGTLNENIPVERYFKEFLENGGETGYTEMISIEQYEKQLKKLTEGLNMKNATGRAFEAVGEGVEFANRCIENLCRFSAYQTSREAGMSILKSIEDAKEVSVNFNRKGSGAMGQKWAKAFYMFLNPAIQSLAKRILLTKKFPKKMAAVWAGEFVMGATAPLLWSLIRSMFGDDEDKDELMGNYFNLTDYRRRSGLCLPGKDGVFHIPLSHEARALYGLGELFTSYVMGHEEYDNVPVQIFNTLSQALPLNPLDGWAPGENILESMAYNLTPDAVKPIAEVIMNRDFAGNKVHNRSDFNEFLPEYMRGKRGTADIYKSISKVLSGKEIYGKGLWDNLVGTLVNPSTMEHLVEGYLGGAYSFADKAVKTGKWILGNEEYAEFKNVPIGSSFYTSLTKYEDKPREERTRRDWEDAFKFYQQEVKYYDDKETAAKNGEKNGEESGTLVLEQMERNGEVLMVDIFNDGNDRLKELYSASDVARRNREFDKAQEIDKQIYAEKRDIVERMEKLADDPMIGYTFKRNKIKDVYGELETYGDVRDENIINDFQTELQPIQDEFMKVEDWEAYKKLHEKELGMYEDLDEIERGISNEKSKMKENPVYAEEGMTKIRTLRAEAVELINKYRNE